MKTKRYITLASILALIFTFLYTFNINFDLNKQLNLANLAIILVVLILWLLSGYILLIKDIFAITENERNGITLVLVLLAIIFFYYNPFPNPESFFITIPRVIYFILTIIIFLLLIIAFWKENLTPLISAIFIPFSVQSYLVNIKGITQYTSYTLYVIIFFIAIAYTLNYFRGK